jgi:hypothetical protein
LQPRSGALNDLRNRVTQQVVEHVALSRAWVLNRLMRHAQVCLGEIPLRLKVRKGFTVHSTYCRAKDAHVITARDFARFFPSEPTT